MINDIKICTYAICKNETSFVERWIDSVWNNGKGTDYICVADTGSTDDTVEHLKQYSKLRGIPDENIIISTVSVIPWRFDVARNESLKLVPSELVDICFCVDLDEVVSPQFWEDLREIVYNHPNFNRIFYKYAWKLNSDGTPSVVYWYDKIHKPIGWKWEFPVHETLTKDQSCNYEGAYYLNSEIIYLKHFPDNLKSRSNYLDLLKLRVEENENDLYGQYYLAREFSFRNDTNNCLKVAIGLYNKLVKENKSKEAELALLDKELLPSICILIGDMFYLDNMREDAQHFYNMGFKYNPGTRKAYIKSAQLYAYRGNYSDCYSTLYLMEKNSTYFPDWRSEQYYWSEWKKFQIIADAKSWEQKYDEAESIMDTAYEILKNSGDQSYAIQEGFYNDYAFIKSNNRK